ncbi:MAG: hypothetical protein L6282_08945 [Candidatus Methanoperedenaceae archaeon]|nr:hypothetical protein [Candidatus Methanoperedenaceae archaeon]
MQCEVRVYKSRSAPFIDTAPAHRYMIRPMSCAGICRTKRHLPAASGRRIEDVGGFLQNAMAVPACASRTAEARSGAKNKTVKIF